MGGLLFKTSQQTDNIQTSSIIWLDALVNSSQENRQAQQQLRTFVNHLLTFEDDQRCLNHIQSIAKDDRIILIVSGKLGRKLVPKIVHLRQIIGIYIYCMNKEANEQWAQPYFKVKGVFVRLNDLIHQIESDQTQEQREKIEEALTMNMFITNVREQGQTSTGINGQFLHSQLLIDCLIRMEPSADERRELIVHCKEQYKTNSIELRRVNEFEHDYCPKKALRWYTNDSFVYKLLNKALRVQNIRLLYLFRFFIRDLEQELEKSKCSLPVHVYRGQSISKDELKTLKDSIGEYISINSFLSASLNRERARDFLSDKSKDDLEKVLFEIDADPHVEKIKPFGDISSFSFYPTEEEVLFMIGSIFRLVKIVYDSDGFWNIRMILCSENDHQLLPLFQHMREELDNAGINLLRFGHILRRMGKLDDAEKYYHRYLIQLPPNHPDISNCYHALGKVADAKGKYDSSLIWYNKSLQIDMETLDADHLNFAAIHNSIAIAHCKKGDYIQALESYEKALMILKKAYGEDHHRVAECLNNMGGVYYNENNYSKALECHENALIIRQNQLPPEHPHLASSHNNIGIIDRCLGNYDQALEHFNGSLEIKAKSLPPQHPDLASTLENIALVYEDKGDFEQAFFYFDKAAKTYRQTLPSTHVNVININECITRVISKM